MERLLKMIKLHEGVKSHAYQCTAGKWTIGVGRNIDEEGGLGLSEEEINVLLINDVERVKNELTAVYFWFPALDEVRQAAMIDMCFNLGLSRLRGFVKAIEAMSRQQYDNAADEFLDSRWASQVGQRAIRVTEMIRTGEYQ
jgi:lysozyme